jgi:hypothetical protein
MQTLETYLYTLRKPPIQSTTTTTNPTLLTDADLSSFVIKIWQRPKRALVAVGVFF